MLARLRSKYANRLEQMTLVQGSYLEVPFGEAQYDYAVSVMTLHHLTPRSKGQLYERIRQALKDGGKYIEGDYVVSEQKAGQMLAEYRKRMNRVEGGGEGAYHIDIPLTMGMQRELLLEAGFSEAELLWEEGEAIVYVAET
jgi:tRNA (cmo5U34)-methyltransferase